MSINADQQKLLDQLILKLKEQDEGHGNLDAVVLYGSAVAGEFQPEFSDLNVLCLLRRLDAAALRKLSPLIAWWQEQKQPALMLFTVEELRRSADVFAIELYDIKKRHRVLLGKDYFPTLEVPMGLHRLQVERELRTSIIKLRQRYLAAHDDAKAVVRLMTDSISTFITLFQHALIAMGEEPPLQKREVVGRIATLPGFDRKPFDSILDLREKKIDASQLDATSIFSGYLNAVNTVVDEVDRRLS
jgi:predicted nucleotidyltransferase